MKWEKSTRCCPKHPNDQMTFTQSKTQLVCTVQDCNHYERVEATTATPKPVARALHRLRKRTRLALRKKTES